MAPSATRHSDKPRSPVRKSARQPAARAAGTDGGSPGWLTLLQCPHCGGALQAQPHEAACAACGRSVPVRADILDFVGGQQSTALDHIDYDAFYKISLPQSEAQFRQVVQTAGARWPRTLGAVLEIGCGTGGFTMGLAKAGSYEQAVLTDVSPKMLEMCRGHLERLQVLDPRRIGFATYGGTEDCFRPHGFDSCVGAWVVHHITDVPRFFRQVWTTLKPGGRAFFLEPNQRFHQALIATLCDIIDQKLANGMDPATVDIVNTMTWIAETRFNIVNSGDLEVLAGREDKHLFIGEALEQMALAAGFDGAESLAFGYDPQGISTARAYLSQCDVSEAWIDEVARLLPSLGERYFSLLHARDQAPSFLVWLTRSADPPPAPGAARATTPVGAAIENIRADDLRYWLEFTRLDATHPDTVVVEGWCLGPVGIKALEFTHGAETFRLCPHRPRLDVHKALNAGRLYPSVHSLCSGLDGIMSWNGLTHAEEAPLRVTARTVKGSVIELGQVSLPAPGDKATLRH